MNVLPLLLLVASVAPVPSQDPLPDPRVLVRDEDLVEVQRAVHLMGTTLRLNVWGDSRSSALGASESAIRAVEQLAAQLSTWRPDSELSRLAAGAPDEWFELSPELGALLQVTFRWAKESAGAFDPSITPLVQAWDLRGTGRFPTEAQLKRALASSGLHHFRSELPRRLAPLVANAGIEEGGFGKGAALDEARRILAASSIQRATLDLGGQWLYFSKHAKSAAPVPLAIAHPDHRAEPIAYLQMRAGSLATSGNSERGLQVNGVRVGHLLDPRTGQPAPDFGSVSVWCPSALDADCLSTALYVLGPEAGLRFVEERAQLEAVFVIRDGDSLRLRASSGLRDRLSPVDSELPIEWGLPAAR